MGRRSRTVLVLEVQIPIPPGHTQKQTVDYTTQVLKTMAHYGSSEIITRIVRKNVTYY